MTPSTHRAASTVGLVLLTLADLVISFMFYCQQAVLGAADGGRPDGARSVLLVLMIACALTPVPAWSVRVSRPKLSLCLAGWPVATICLLIGVGVLAMTQPLKR